MDKMINRIEIQNQIVEYEHKVNRRARGLRLSVHPGGRIVVSSRPDTSKDFIAAFMRRKAKWILSKLEYMKTFPIQDPTIRKQEFQKHKSAALVLAKARVEYFSKMYGVRPGKISIKNHKTLWGSCSRRGDVNFNYKIAIIPPEHADYVVVHELCHLIEFNHSDRFWRLVAQTVPNHRLIRREMRKSGMNFS